MFKPKKVGWSDWGRRGLREGEGNCLKYLKRGWNRKEGTEKMFLKRGQAGPRGACLKREVGWNPLYELWITMYIPKPSKNFLA